MNKLLRFIRRTWLCLRAAVFITGLLFICLMGLLFTQQPYRIYRHYASLPPQAAAAPQDATPTHLLLMAGGAVPSESALMRTFEAARLAKTYPHTIVLLATPEAAAQSTDTRAYLAELHLRGIPPERIHVLSGGRNTREQAITLLEYLSAQENKEPVLGIVTSPEHIRRTAAAISRLHKRLPLRAFPAWPESLEDDLTYSPAELAAPESGAPPPAAAHLGTSTLIRYHFWGNLAYLTQSARECVALAYYKLLRWA